MKKTTSLKANAVPDIRFCLYLHFSFEKNKSLFNLILVYHIWQISLQISL